VLPLLKGICAMTFEVPRELSNAIGPTDAVPTVALQRFLSTRLAQIMIGVAFDASAATTTTVAAAAAALEEAPALVTLRPRLPFVPFIYF
jgi:hypothetical protein